MNYRMISYVLGNILRVEGMLMLPSALVSLYFGERAEFRAFAGVIAFLLIFGTLVEGGEPKEKRIYGREGFVIVSLSWVLMSVFGAMPFFISGSIDGYVNCLFETISGFTTTGASILTEIESLPKGILFWRSFTHWIGGMGILIFMLAILPMGDDRSMYIMRAEAPGPMVSKLVPKVKSTAKGLYMIYIILTFAEIMLLFLGGMPIFDSVVNAFATAGTGGFSIKNASIAAYNNAYFEYVITIFMILFSINFNLFYLLCIRDFKDVFKNEELRFFFAIIALATILITLDISRNYETIEMAFRHAVFQVASVISTTGFVTANFEVWPEFSKTVLVCIMIIGACGGSTGGGIKVSRFIILLKMVLQEIRRIVHPRSVNVIKLDGYRVENDVIHGVTAYLIVYLFLVFASFLLISLDNYDFTTSLTSVLTCMSNVGPGLAKVGPVENFSFFSAFSKIVLCLDMILGRLEIFPIIMLFFPSIWRKGYM